MRYTLIDSLRGISVISMILYHGAWDIVYIFNHDIPGFTGLPGYIWEQSICWSFILISGFCQYLARHSIKNAIIISLAGLLVTVITILFPIGVEIYYGILTFLGLAIFITALIKPLFKRINPVLGFSVSFLLFIIFKEINQGYLGFGDLVITNLPATLYPAHLGWINTLIGFPAHDFNSGDYFSLFPWYFLFISGFFLASFFKSHNFLNKLNTPKIPVINFLGEHALLIYLVHQPLTFLILELIFH